MNVNGHDDDNNVQSVGQIVPSESYFLIHSFPLPWFEVFCVICTLSFTTIRYIL